jgi:eukaryotic-like serine/threonine-protein kinase
MSSQGSSDPEVVALVSAERLREAAELSSSRGNSEEASELFERACLFAEAARAALVAKDAERALTLAAEAGDDALAHEALSAVLARKDTRAGEKVAVVLERRGHLLWAARVYEGLGEIPAAAKAYGQGGDPVHGAALLEASGEPVQASAMLESAARKDPQRFEVLVALGGLLLRYGKTEAATRALQRVPSDSPYSRAALTYLVPALDRLGLHAASEEAARVLAASGGPIEAAALTTSTTEAKTRLFGRYEVVREIASTPSARVLLCTDCVRGEKVAVKIFAAYDSRGAGRDALARFEREVRVLGALEHPNVVPLRDYIPEGPALVLAWMGGGTLERRIAEGHIAPDRAVEIASSILVALGEAHRLGILHRDIKPANVLFDDAGAARLADFGVAHLGDASATATAGVFGTLAYMSPEQREGRPATLQSDLYGVGVLLLEMLTSEKPVPGQAPRTLPSAAHRDLDARHDKVVLRLKDDDPAARPSDAFAARRELRSLRWPKDVELAPFSTVERRPPSTRPPSGAPPAASATASGRLVESDNGELVDTWLERRIVRTTWSDESLVRASTFARLGHPRLQGILRADREAHVLWLETPHGAPATRPLDDAELRQAREMLEALHHAGMVHGRIDAEHVRLSEEGVYLLFSASADPSASFDQDLAALTRLGRAV